METAVGPRFLFIFVMVRRVGDACRYRDCVVDAIDGVVIVFSTQDDIGGPCRWMSPVGAAFVLERDATRMEKGVPVLLPFHRESCWSV